MGKIVVTIVFLCLTAIGLSIVYWSSKLSIRYNAWTTSFRERHPSINPPPKPHMRALNTKIMTWLFRFAGVYIILYSAYLISKIW